MSRESEALVEALWQHIWIDGDLDRLADIVADPYVRHTRDGTDHTTPERYARHISSVVETIKGTEVRIDHIASLDDYVFARLTLFGVNIVVGNTVKISWLSQYRIVDGRIAEAWTLHQSDLNW